VTLGSYQYGIMVYTKPSHSLQGKAAGLETDRESGTGNRYASAIMLDGFKANPTPMAIKAIPCFNAFT